MGVHTKNKTILKKDPQLFLRKAEKGDRLFYYKVRNNPLIRKYSFNQKPITLDEHNKWFFEKLNSKNSYLSVICTDNRRIGQVRVDTDGKNGEISISIIPEYQGKGLSLSSIKMACENAFNKTKKLENISAFIRLENKISQRSFEKVGFIPNGVVNYKKNMCTKMTFKRKWQ